MPDFSGSSIDHINLAVADVERSKAFYEKALASIGIELLLAIPAEQSGSRGAMFGFGTKPKPFFWIIGEGRVGENTHIAFTVEDRASVHAFHQAALGAGGQDNGPPGVRTMYHPNYYGAFVLDPDGINIEAVCHAPE